MSAVENLEVCPFCGQFVRCLLDITGWCASCSYREGRSCTRCQERKPFDHFSRDKTRLDGRRPVCRTCDTAARKARARRNAPAGSRTRTPLRAADFEPAASTSSATGAAQEATR